ncbi:hypothetical protein IID62_09935 [candidate division KSB1 bacterium]|nr:hypothetical protein [candidate division KSB1 bacterium]
MEIRLYKEDLEKLLKGKELSHVLLPVGTLKIYDFRYEDGKLMFLFDYPLGKSMQCSFQDFKIEGNNLKCECNIESSLVRTILKLVKNIPALRERGISLNFPQLSFDISKLNLPITPQDIECLNEEVRIIGELKEKD